MIRVMRILRHSLVSKLIFAVGAVLIVSLAVWAYSFFDYLPRGVALNATLVRWR